MFLDDYKMSGQTHLSTDVFDSMRYTASNLTESQNELVQRFNAAFYEAQNRSQTCDSILDTFDECYFSNIEKYETEASHDNYLLDFLISKNHDATSSEQTTPSSDNASTFDYSEFAENFEQVIEKEGGNAADVSSEAPAIRETALKYTFGEVFTTCDRSCSNDDDVYDDVKVEDYGNRNCMYGNFTKIENFASNPGENSPFFVPLPFTTSRTSETGNEESFEYLDLSDGDLYDNLSNSSFDFENINANFSSCEYESPCYVPEQQKLPPVNTIIKNNVDFMSFIRGTPADDLDYRNQAAASIHRKPNPYGHLVGNKNVNNNISSYPDETNETHETNDDNLVVTSQNEALIYDDPLLSSSSLVMAKRRTRRNFSESEIGSDCEELMVASTNLQCQWKGCYQLYDSQNTLVRHIEKSHVEVKRGGFAPKQKSFGEIATIFLFLFVPQVRNSRVFGKIAPDETNRSTPATNSSSICECTAARNPTNVR